MAELAPNRNVLVIDLETTGLPCAVRGRGPEEDTSSYRCLAKYDTARIVAVSWVVLRGGAPDEEVAREYHVVNSGCVIPEVAQRVHGISTEHAALHGVSFSRVVVPRLASAVRHLGVGTLVAHNLNFDRNVLLSELHRLASAEGADADSSEAAGLLRALEGLRECCTMRLARQLLRLPKFPKLADLYQRFFGREMGGAHHALHDTVHCAEVYARLVRLQREEEEAEAGAQQPAQKQAQARADALQQSSQTEEPARAPPGAQRQQAYDTRSRRRSSSPPQAAGSGRTIADGAQGELAASAGGAGYTFI